MDSATAPATPQPSHDDDAKWALLLEYDAADFRGRHELLDRERITVRDIARWRRETAKLRASNGNAGPVRAAKSRAGKAASAGADAPPESAPAPQPTPEEQPTGVGRSRRRSKSAEGAPPPPPRPALRATERRGGGTRERAGLPRGRTVPTDGGGAGQRRRVPPSIQSDRAPDCCCAGNQRRRPRGVVSEAPVRSHRRPGARLGRRVVRAHRHALDADRLLEPRGRRTAARP